MTCRGAAADGIKQAAFFCGNGKCKEGKNITKAESMEMSHSTRTQPSLPNSFVISVARREGCAQQRQVKDCTRFHILPPPPDSSRAGNRDPGPVQCTLNRDAFPVYNPVPHGYSSKSITNTKVAGEGHGRLRNSSLRPKVIYWHTACAS